MGVREGNQPFCLAPGSGALGERKYLVKPVFIFGELSEDSPSEMTPGSGN